MAVGEAVHLSRKHNIRPRHTYDTTLVKETTGREGKGGWTERCRMCLKVCANVCEKRDGSGCVLGNCSPQLSCDEVGGCENINSYSKKGLLKGYTNRAKRR